MPPITFTEVLETPVETKSVKCNLTHTGKLKGDVTPTISPYDQILNRYNPPIYMRPVRQWEKRLGFVTPIRWINTFLIVTFHVSCVVWFLKQVYYFNLPKWQTVIFGYIMGQIAGFGVTAGAHRLWSHRSYKARGPLKVILLICYSVAGQNTMYEWVRDHRVHHKFSETTADPHDANRGFFFSHVGWLMMKKHPDVIREGEKMDMTDILSDPYLQFHTRYFFFFKAMCCWIIPCLVPWLVWGESGELSVLSQAFTRYMMSLNFTWSVNSFAHLWGNKPYDKHIMPCENRGVSIVAMGEGWHNYHHTFPWDYKAAELGVTNNITTTILDMFAKIGWAYDLKQASPELVKAVARNRGESKHEKEM